MNGISADLSEKYAPIISRITEKIPGAVILSAKDSYYPVFRQKVRFGVASLRKPDILEEYIMKAASLDIEEDTDIDFLSVLLGLDVVFLEDCINKLSEKKIIQSECLPVVKLTENGLHHLKKGTFPDDEQIEEIGYYIDKKSGLFYTSLAKDSSAKLWDKYSIVAKHKESIKKYITRKFICDVGRSLGREIEPEDGSRRIVSVISAKLTAEAGTLITEFTAQVPGIETPVCVIWDYAHSMFRDDLAEIINKFA